MINPQPRNPVILIEVGRVSRCTRGGIWGSHLDGGVPPFYVYPP
jgi:hypothetical protein